MENQNSKIKALILDMDGVLWRGDQPIGDLPAVFDLIRRKSLLFTLATNNATMSIEQFVSKVANYGVHLQSFQVINSSEATAYYMKKRFPGGGAVFVIGEGGLIGALAEAGFYLAEKDVLAVVAAMDRNLSYEKLARATLLIRAGTLFIGTNPDRTYPTPQGLVPGAGAILAALQAATDVEPLIIGKPQPEMYRLAMERMHVLPEETLVVGDRLETDIIGAQQLGCKTGLVLSGVTSADAASAWDPKPDFIEPDLTSLVEKL
jgi:4-nitrophenyl phosphatase